MLGSSIASLVLDQSRKPFSDKISKSEITFGYVISPVA